VQIKVFFAFFQKKPFDKIAMLVFLPPSQPGAAFTEPVTLRADYWGN